MNAERSNAIIDSLICNPFDRLAMKVSTFRWEEDRWSNRLGQFFSWLHMLGYRTGCYLAERYYDYSLCEEGPAECPTECPNSNCSNAIDFEKCGSDGYNENTWACSVCGEIFEVNEAKCTFIY